MIREAYALGIGVTGSAHGVEKSSRSTLYDFFRNRFLFEGTTAGGAEQTYKNAVPHLTQLLAEDGLFHTIGLKRKSQQKRKNAAAPYQYQAGCDGE